MKLSLFKIALLLMAFTGMQAQQSAAVSVYFDTDAAAVLQRHKPQLDSIAVQAKRAFSFSLSIDGYTDGTGRDEYNQALALKRATAVRNYLISQKLDSTVISVGTHTETSEKRPDAGKRKVTVRLDHYRIQSYRAEKGTVVLSPVEVQIREFFSAEEMIANEKFAIDEQGDILLTSGMIELCFKESDVISKGKSITVQMPYNKGVIDEPMDIYVEVANAKGEKSWRLTPIRPVRDKSGAFLTFDLPAETLLGNCIAINGDMKPKTRIVHVLTKERFSDIEVRDEKGKLSFSVYRKTPEGGNEYIFVSDLQRDVAAMTIIGKSQGKLLEMPLSDFIKEVVPRKSPDEPSHEYFRYRDASNPLKKPGYKEGEHGFWAWLRRIFSGKK